MYDVRGLRSCPKKTLYQLLALFLVISLFGNACAPRKAASVKPAPTLIDAIKADDPLSALRKELDNIFNDSFFQNSFWGVMVQSLDSGEILYQRNENKLLMPASNMKILTGAASLIKLGPEYMYQTRVYADGEITEGVLIGNLVVLGSGDPTISGRFADGDPTRIFKLWADRLKSMGISKITGDIIGVDDVFDKQRLGVGWAWDYLSYSFAAEVSGLQFNENSVDLLIRPGERAGMRARISKRPDTTYVEIINDVLTVEKGEPEIRLSRPPESNIITISGTIPLGVKELARTASVDNPTAYFVYVLKEVFEQSGISIDGSSYDAQVRGYRYEPRQLKLLLSHTSPKLSEVIAVLLKDSQNLYAETLVKTLGYEFKREGSFEAGRRVLEEVLGGFGVPASAYIMVDGSGLSRYNYLSAALLVRVLRGMYRHPHFKAFYDALPIAGVDGTIKERMKGTRAEGNVRAKTGTIANVRSLSGYLKTADGELLAFSMIANNFNVPDTAAEYLQDLALERLANFSRK